MKMLETDGTRIAADLALGLGTDGDARSFDFPAEAWDELCLRDIVKFTRVQLVLESNWAGFAREEKQTKTTRPIFLREET
jgi:hypothetical protein